MSEFELVLVLAITALFLMVCTVMYFVTSFNTKISGINASFSGSIRDVSFANQECVKALTVLNDEFNDHLKRFADVIIELDDKFEAHKKLTQLQVDTLTHQSTPDVKKLTDDILMRVATVLASQPPAITQTVIDDLEHRIANVSLLVVENQHDIQDVCSVLGGQAVSPMYKHGVDITNVLRIPSNSTDSSDAYNYGTGSWVS